MCGCVCLVHCTPAIDCGNPGPALNAITHGNLFTFPNAVSYLCRNGFLPNHTTTITCTKSGTWSGNPPSCQPVICHHIPPPAWGYLNSTNSTFASVILFSCSKGFHLVGVDVLVCQASGLWNSHVPRCVPVQCANISLHRYSVLNSVNNTFQGQAVMACARGHQLSSGDLRRTCTAEGSWSGSEAVCTGTTPFMLGTVWHVCIFVQCYTYPCLYSLSEIVVYDLRFHTYEAQMHYRTRVLKLARSKGAEYSICSVGISLVCP